mgnify:CR=1 FL=1
MKRRAFCLHLGTGGLVGLGSCAALPGSYSIDTSTADVCERESTVTNVVQQFAAPTDVGPDHWAAGESEPVGHLELYDSAERARRALPLEALPAARRDAVDAFVADTYFRNALLLYVASVGPTPAHDTIRLCGLRVDAGTIRGRAVVPRRDDEGDDGDETYPSALVRVVAGDPRPDTARLTVETAGGVRQEFSASLAAE